MSKREERAEVRVFDACGDCAHNMWKREPHGYICKHPSTKGADIPDNATIPKWCPLPRPELFETIYKLCELIQGD